MCSPINKIMLHVLPWFDGLQTNPKLLSSGVICFWTPANILWLDFFIDSARAVKVSLSPDSQWLTFTETLAQTVVIIFRYWCFFHQFSKHHRHLLEKNATYFKYPQILHMIWLLSRCKTVLNPLAANEAEITDGVTGVIWSAKP